MGRPRPKKNRFCRNKDDLWNGQTGVCEKNVGAPQCQRHSCRPPIPPQINVTKLRCRVKIPLAGIRRLFFFWTLTLFPDRPCNTELGGRRGSGQYKPGILSRRRFFRKHRDGLIFVGGMNPCDLLMKQFKKQFKVLGFHGNPQIDLLFYLAKQ